MSERMITFGEGPLSIEDVVDLARRHAAMQLSSSSEFQEKISWGAALLDGTLRSFTSMIQNRAWNLYDEV